VKSGVARCELDIVLDRSLLDRDLGRRERADHVEDQPARQHDGARADDLGRERDAEADVGVGRSELTDRARGVELDAGEGLDRAPGGGDARDHLQLSKERVSLDRDLHDGYLIRKVEVIGESEVLGSAGIPAASVEGVDGR
jgi:hypothetical protein